MSREWAPLGARRKEDKMFWVLLAPGLASCFCFITEGFIESLRKGFEAIGRCRGKIW